MDCRADRADQTTLNAKLRPVPQADLRQRFSAFITDRFPFALTAALAAFDKNADGCGPALAKSIAASLAKSDRAVEVTPGISAEARIAKAAEEIEAACRGFFRRDALRASLSADERREILRGM